MQADDVPALSRGVRFRRLDSNRAVLLIPEGVVNLNPTAAAVLELLDGKRSAAEISAELGRAFAAPENTIAPDVGELLDRLCAAGWVFFSRSGQ